MKKFLIANWKSNKTIVETQHWAETFTKQAEIAEDVVVAVAPPFTAAPTLSERLQSPAVLAAQDISPYPAGSYTGAITAKFLTELNTKYVIVGHSERRRHFSETHAQVGQKVDQALQNGITPVVCVDKEYIAKQANAISSDQLADCIVAYEPLAAIGSGNSEDVGTVKDIATEIKEVFGDVPVLYGGSVNPENVLEYTLVSDGVLVGSASLDPEVFARLVSTVSAAV